MSLLLLMKIINKRWNYKGGIWIIIVMPVMRRLWMGRYLTLIKRKRQVMLNVFLICPLQSLNGILMKTLPNFIGQIFSKCLKRSMSCLNLLENKKTILILRMLLWNKVQHIFQLMLRVLYNFWISINKLRNQKITKILLFQFRYKLLTVN